MYIFSHLKDLKLFFSSSYLQIWNPLSITRQISRRRCILARMYQQIALFLFKRRKRGLRSTTSEQRLAKSPGCLSVFLKRIARITTQKMCREMDQLCHFNFPAGIQPIVGGKN